MATIKATIDSRRSIKKNGFQIIIRIQHDRKKKEDIPTGEYLPKLEYFDKKTGKVKKRKGLEYERINELIFEKIVFYKKRFKSNPTAVSLKSKEDVLAEFERLLTKLEAEGKYNSKRIILYAYKYLKEFLNEKTTLLVDEIDDVFLDDYKVFLLGKNLKSGTIKSYVEKLRMIHNLIVDRLQIIKHNPFKNFKVDKEENKHELTEQFLKDFINYIPSSKERILYKNMFLSMFFLQGTRVSDILTIRYNNLLIEGLNNEPKIDKFSKESEKIAYYFSLGKKTDYSKVNFSLEFKAFKTGHTHIIPLSNKAILQLRFFLDTDLQLRYLNAFDHPLYDKELRIFLSERIKVSYLKSEEDEVLILKELIIEQHKRNPNKPIFHNFNIDGLKGNDLKKFIQSKTSYINKSLTSNEKDEYYKTRLKTHISCHCARHLFAICFYSHKKDIYGLSKLLFHKKVQTTENYLKRLNVRIHSKNDALDFYDNF
ncbi:MAG: site-specific integrase [Tissierellales bacterium]|jgi:site-specific recombinase XerD|nr:site-specific integrase [Tissierellales bacterium]